MAFVSTNPLVNGLSGMLGKSLVFKNYYGRTIVASRPRSPKKQSESQKANRSKFRDASLWARAELRNPARKAYYQQKAKQLNLPNAYTAAITDYMRKPTVTKAISPNKITYTVQKKDFALKQVTAQQFDGSPVAVKVNTNTSEFWVFEVPADTGIQFNCINMSNSMVKLIG